MKTAAGHQGQDPEAQAQDLYAETSDFPKYGRQDLVMDSVDTVNSAFDPMTWQDQKLEPDG
eukprot:gene8330-14294_t